MSKNQLTFGEMGKTDEEKPPVKKQWSSLLNDLSSSKKNAQEIASNNSPELAETTPVQKDEPEEHVFSVSEINKHIKKRLEGEFCALWIKAEISNFKAHSSGHFYFSLKDEKSQISAVMFKGFNTKLKFIPESGMEVLVYGRVTVYEPRGNYQIFCETLEPVGAGALQKAFEDLKKKLKAEGLFDQKHKMPLPVLPVSIGVVTSPTGAAIKDILNVLARRYPGAKITVLPARVQGETAGKEVAKAIQVANKLSGFDVLIVGRGGGSIEDLWGFNEEVVARAIYASKIPIISAVGHEIDYTISDFVADYRAPTPSAAAEVVASSVTELSDKINQQLLILKQRLSFKLKQAQQRVDGFSKRLSDPKRRVQDLQIRCDELTDRLSQSVQSSIQKKRIRLERYSSDRFLQSIHTLLRFKQNSVAKVSSVLDSVSPLATLGRGFAIVTQESKIITKYNQLSKGDEIQVALQEGGVTAVIGSTFEEAKWNSRKN